MKRFIYQVLQFIGISGIGWVLDFITYVILGFFNENHSFNNFISSWVGVTFVFFFATRRVFENNSHISIWIKYAIYIIYQFVLIYFISKMLGNIDEIILFYAAGGFISKFSGILAKIIVTPITMFLNFFVLKGVIERL